MKRNFESNIPMGYRRKIERAQMMQRSDVYGTDIFNDGITASIREVSPCRDRVCGEFDVPVGKVDCPQYEADAESTGVKWFIKKNTFLIMKTILNLIIYYGI